MSDTSLSPGEELTAVDSAGSLFLTKAHFNQSN